jgi:hypothetical protein
MELAEHFNNDNSSKDENESSQREHCTNKSPDLRGSVKLARFDSMPVRTSESCTVRLPALDDTSTPLPDARVIHNRNIQNWQRYSQLAVGKSGSFREMLCIVDGWWTRTRRWTF